jgi:hypothetical protein
MLPDRSNCSRQVIRLGIGFDGSDVCPADRTYRPLRGEFGLVFGEREQRRMNLALARIRRLYPRLPMRIRAVGPYQEALARLQGERQPDLAVRWLNRLWIGRPMME